MKFKVGCVYECLRTIPESMFKKHHIYMCDTEGELHGMPSESIVKKAGIAINQLNTLFGIMTGIKFDVTDPDSISRVGYTCTMVNNIADSIPEVYEVDHPSYYNNGPECIDIMENIYGIEAVIDFSLCNAFKYLYRCKHKNTNKTVEDINKAIWYLQKFVELSAKK